MASVRLAALVFFGIAIFGCTRQDPPITQQEAHLKALAVCYGRFLAQHRGTPPKSEAEFKEFIQKMPADQLPGGSSDPNSLFVSPRDNQPYVVRYDLDRSQLMPGPKMPIIAHEQTGVDGKRYVADIVGQVKEVEEAEFNELVSGAGGAG
jgi:hypothetical protein